MILNINFIIFFINQQSLQHLTNYMNKSPIPTIIAPTNIKTIDRALKGIKIMQKIERINIVKVFF